MHRHRSGSPFCSIASRHRAASSSKSSPNVLVVFTRSSPDPCVFEEALLLIRDRLKSRTDSSPPRESATPAHSKTRTRPPHCRATIQGSAQPQLLGTSEFESSPIITRAGIYILRGKSSEVFKRALIQSLACFF